jgi:hypothetical protein
MRVDLTWRVRDVNLRLKAENAALWRVAEAAFGRRVA